MAHSSGQIWMLRIPGPPNDSDGGARVDAPAGNDSTLDRTTDSIYASFSIHYSNI